MRGADVMQEALFTVKRLDEFVPPLHPLRAIRDILNTALASLDAKFDSMYAPTGRDSIAPEKLLRALVLQAVYSIRSERAQCEHLGYNMLYRWFVGIPMQAEVWDHSSFTRNRDRLIEHDGMRALFGEIIDTAERAGLLSDEHFSVDGTLMENCNGLAVDCEVTKATATAESDCALEPIARQPHAATLGADNSYDTHDFVSDCRGEGVTPHVAQNTARNDGSAIDGPTTRHAGYAVSQHIRRRIENRILAVCVVSAEPFSD